MDLGRQDDLRALVDAVPVVVWEAEPPGERFTFVSGHAEALSGHPVERWRSDPASVVHPDDRDRVVRARREAAGDFEVTYRVVAAGGGVRWVREQVRVGWGGVLRGVLVEVTAQRAAEERNRFLAELDRALQRLDGAGDIMAAATRLLGEHLLVDRCAYARAEDDEDHFVMSGDYSTGLPPLPGRFAMRAFGEGAVAAMRAGRPWVVPDSADDGRLSAEDVATYRATGIRAVICLPLLRGGRFVAAMAVHQASVRHWTPEEVELVSVVVNRCWESLQRAHADGALRDSERRHRLLVERATDAIWVLDHDRRFVEVNPAACALLGSTRAELVGAALADRLVDGDPGVGAGTAVWEMRRADSSTVSVEVSVQATPTGVQAIGRDVTERRRAEAERELLARREHEIAEALQRSLLPRELPDLDRLATAARYLPAASHAQIGGDWYEVLPLEGTAVALTIGDVVGKGPTAAAVMGQLRSALAGYLLDGHSPAAALDRLDAFARRTPGAAGSTCACLVLDWDTGDLRWGAAGHPPPLLVDAGGGRFLTGDPGPVLAAPGRAPYRDARTRLVAGASVLLYTDGLVERRGAVIDDGLDRLREIAADSHALAPDDLADRVVAAMLRDGQDDDVALAVARLLPAPLVRTAPALPPELARMRAEVATWAAAAGLGATLLDDLQLALGEAAANAVDHAYPHRPGEFTYRLSATASGVHARLHDGGRWRPPPADPGNRGRGLTIIRAVGQNPRIDHDDTGTTVDFDLSRLRVPPARPAVASAPPRPANLTEVSTPDADRRVLRLEGDLDLDTSAALGPALLAAVADDDPRPIDIDLTAVGYLSSSGIALLLTAAATGRSLSAVVLRSSAPARILSLSGLHDLITTTDGEPLAVRWADSPPAATG